MKKIMYLLILILLIGCQNSGTEFHSKEFKWQITIPKNYDNLPIDKKSQERGKKMIEETYNQKVNIVAIPIFNFMKGNTTKFKAQYTVLDSTQDFITEVNQSNETMMTTFKNVRPDSKIDTTTSIKIISGIEFKKFKMKIHGTNTNGLNSYFLSYSRLFENKMLDILVVYQDELDGNEIITALENSVFEQ